MAVAPAYILGLDVGNTNIVIGLFQNTKGFEILYHWRIITKPESSSDELGIFLLGFLASVGLEPRSIHGLVYSSVVPSWNHAIRQMAQNYFFQNKPLHVSWNMGLPLEFDYPRPEEIGADRLVNASAAVVLYGGDMIVVDMGTATTFCVIHDGKSYVGGSIAPGLRIAMESLGQRTAQLPSIEFRCPPSGVIGRSTIEALQAGFFYGWVGMLREILDRIRSTDSRRNYKVIATGGFMHFIHKEFPEIFDEVDPLLTLRGLKCIYGRLQGASASTA